MKKIRYIFNSGLSRNEQIAELIKLDITTRDIQTIMRCGPNIISTIRKSLDLTGYAPEQSKMGRPSKRMPEVKSFIVEQTTEDPYISGEDIHNTIKCSMDVDIGSSTMNSIRTDCGFKFLPPIQQPQLTDLQITKRLNFCYSVLLHKDSLPSIGFSDESRFGLGCDKRWVWRKRKEFNPKTVSEKTKYAISVMAWDMICYNYRPDVYIYEGTENAQNYQEMLEENSYLIDALTFNEGNFAFQQDGARPHTAKTSIEAITSICDLIANWPPNSPDLNVIEMIWSIMNRSIAFYHPTTKEELIEAIKIAWNSISIETINNLCQSFVRRCLQSKGRCIQRFIKRGMDPIVTDEEFQSLVKELRKDGIILNEIDIFLKRKNDE